MTTGGVQGLSRESAPAPALDGERASYTLLGPDRRPYQSTVKGILGGHRTDRIYGRLDCPAAARALRRGGYRAERVFFADEPTAITAGYRPCAACLPQQYAEWKAAHRTARP